MTTPEPSHTRRSTPGSLSPTYLPAIGTPGADPTPHPHPPTPLTHHNQAVQHHDTSIRFSPLPGPPSIPRQHQPTFTNLPSIPSSNPPPHHDESQSTGPGTCPSAQYRCRTPTHHSRPSKLRARSRFLLISTAQNSGIPGHPMNPDTCPQPRPHPSGTAAASISISTSRGGTRVLTSGDGRGEGTGTGTGTESGVGGRGRAEGGLSHRTGPGAKSQEHVYQTSGDQADKDERLRDGASSCMLWFDQQCVMDRLLSASGFPCSSQAGKPCRF